MASIRVNSTSLVVVPTEFELQRIELRLPEIREHVSLELCGFGPLAAAALVSRTIGRTQPSRVILAGMAGTFSPAVLPVGTACCFQRVAVDGIGAGEATRFVSAQDLGFDLLPAALTGGPLEDPLPLETCPQIPQQGLLLTCCAASDSTVMSGVRLARFPAAAAEDMEGYAVALACHLAGIPLTIVRGISNVVGNRDKRTWAVDQALQATAEALRSVISVIGEPESQL